MSIKGRPFGRRIIVPSYPPLLRACGWAVYENLTAQNSESPLWVRLKLVNYDALRNRRKRGVFRTARVSWSVQQGRLARDSDSIRLRMAVPGLLEAIEKFCAKRFTPEYALARVGQQALDEAHRVEAERMLKKMEQDRERYERAEEQARIEHRARELKAAAKAAGRAVTVDDLM